MSDIHIQGDGNAVGNGNRIFVDKRTTNNYNNKQPKKTPSDPRDMLGISAAVVIVIAIATWKFAQHAPAIFFALQLTAITLVTIQVATLLALNDQPTTWHRHQWIVISATMLLGLGIWISKNSYPLELTQLAQTPHWKTFWCNLRPYGGQLAAYHTLTISLVAVPSLLCASIFTLGGVSRWLWFKSDITLFARMALLQKNSLAWLAMILALVYLFAQLDITQQFWAATYDIHFSENIKTFCAAK